MYAIRSYYEVSGAHERMKSGPKASHILRMALIMFTTLGETSYNFV